MGTSAASALSTLEAARNYVEGRGWAVVPVRRLEKRPLSSDWPSIRLRADELANHFGNGENIGVILGEPSGWLTDIDLDAPQARQLASLFLPKTDCIHGRPGAPSSHLFYKALGAKHESFKDPDGSTLVEIRSKGHQTLLPPSIHPSGVLYAWESEGEPAAIAAGDLRSAVARLATAALIARHWPEEGSRHDASKALAGMLLRGGWHQAETSQFLEAVATAARDEEASRRAGDVITTANRLGQGRPATGAPSLAALIGDEVVRRCRDWLVLADAPAFDASSDVWPMPGRLGDELHAVPAFDLQLLPLSLRALVRDVSERMQAPPDYAATAVIVALAGCVNRRAVIIPKVHDRSWRIVPNLWGAIVARPGMMKSPILQAITASLSHIEKQWRADYEQASSEFTKDKEREELDLQVWKEQYKVAAKSSKDRAATPIRPETTLQPPTQRRLTTTDATFEKLHVILAENPAGILAIRDELAGWLAALDKHGREDERAFFLQAWNGDGPFTVDRIGRGSVHAEAICVSLLGNIQPARLQGYLSDVTQGGPTDDGLFQRFQLIVWPDPLREWQLVDRPADQAASDTAAAVFAALARLSADEPVCLSFAPDAQQLFFDWLADLEHKVRGDTGLPPALVGHLSKYRSLMPTLAGLFELADRAANGDVVAECFISLDHTRRAAAFCDYLEAHAHRIYACALSAETRSARELARHLQARDLSSPFTTRDVYLKGWSGLDSPERVRAALGLLEEAGWIRHVESKPASAGGRPSEVWLVNPKAVRCDK